MALSARARASPASPPLKVNVPKETDSVNLAPCPSAGVDVIVGARLTAFSAAAAAAVARLATTDADKALVTQTVKAKTKLKLAKWQAIYDHYA